MITKNLIVKFKKFNLTKQIFKMLFAPELIFCNRGYNSVFESTKI